MTQLHDLVRLSLPAIINVLHLPGGLIAHGGEAVPELDGGTLVGWVPDHPGDLPVVHQPADLGAEMELFTVGTDRPTALAVEDNPFFGLADNVVQRAVGAGIDIDIGHAFNGHAVEGGGTVGTAAALEDLALGTSVGFLHHLASGDGAHQDDPYRSG